MSINVEMRLNQNPLKVKVTALDKRLRMPVQPDCLGPLQHLSRILHTEPKTESRMKRTRFPESDVPTMGRPCYLAEIDPQKRGFSPVDMPAMR